MVVNEKNYARHLYLTVFLLLVVVFITGVLLGRSVSLKEESDISSVIRITELSTESYIIEQQLIKDFDITKCGLAQHRIKDLSNELFRIGQILNQKDAKKELGETRFNLLKRKYHLMQIKAYLFYFRLTENCDTEDNIILYYYSISDTGEQGFILDSIVNDYKATVFAIEYNYSPELTFLESYYGIKQTPSIVFNYDNIMQGLTNYDDLAMLLVNTTSEQ